ncbi:MAG: hypothetical protein IMZ53_05090 [Thermoplasmata archaeon]|nr:hypothetical protein [Thermoplasmata archaeon]MBE3139943.1 hypothetical protein [Thermoplasmata archaeon]
MKKILLVSAVCLLSIVSLFSGCVNVPMDELVQFSIFSFDVEPGIIDQGESANLSWMVIAASSVSIDNGIGSVALTGHRMIAPTQTTTYLLTASNATLTKNATVTITVRSESNESHETTEISIASFEVTPSIINQGESANLSWVVIGATSVRIDNGIGSVGLSGHRIIMPTVTTTYTLTALNAETSKEANVQIYVHVEQPTPPQQTPNIACTTDSTTNKIQVAVADVNIKWNDIVITNTTGSSNCHWAIYDGGGVTNQTTDVMPTSDVTAGDYIFIWYPPGGNVKITMRYVPTNALLGTWTINV